MDATHRTITRQRITGAAVGGGKEGRGEGFGRTEANTTELSLSITEAAAVGETRGACWFRENRFWNLI